MTSPKNPHPYLDLPKSRFWKTAVADLDPRSIEQLWKPKFSISKDSKIVTAGSCFAQHISRHLRKNGFNWIDSEPAPADLAPHLHADNGFGVFSFRTGNIYTAALLKQWIFWATGRAPQSHEVFIEEDRYYDPFRPAIPADGYASKDELLFARETTLRAMAESLKSADVFIFTLGLTEAWKGKSGEVYPMCPGTICGNFLPELHSFCNFQYEEVLRDLEDAFAELRKLNPTIRFLLTVSPVPLTATASKNHVLTATTYSKSVLRAVAGHLADTREDVDYFPSFELISTHPFKGQFFEANMRSVTNAGVEFVMEQFLSGLGSTKQAAAPQSGASMPRTASSPVPVSSADEVCEDLVLESWSNQVDNKFETVPKLLLVGDSHMAWIGRALDELGIPYAGGAVMNGSQWHNLEFVASNEKFFIPSDEAARERWDKFYKDSFLDTAFPAISDCWMITNIGVQSHVLLEGFASYLSETYGKKPNVISALDVRNYLAGVRLHQFTLIQKFVSVGCKIICVADPPTQPKAVVPVSDLLHNVLSEYFRAMGCSFFNVQEWINQCGGFPAEFMSRQIVNLATGELDRVHGSQEYYRELVTAIFEKFAIKT